MAIRIGALAETITAYGLTTTPDVITFEDTFGSAASLVDTGWVERILTGGSVTKTGSGKVALDTGNTPSPGLAAILRPLDTELDQWYYFRVKAKVLTLPANEQEVFQLNFVTDLGFGQNTLIGVFLESTGEVYTYYSGSPLGTVTPGTDFVLELALRVRVADVDEGGYTELDYQARLDGGAVDEGADINSVASAGRIAAVAVGVLDPSAASGSADFTFCLDEFAYGTYGFIEDGPTEAIDRYGNPVYTEESGVELPAAVQPLAATEDEVNRDTRIQRYHIIVGPDTALDGLTRVEWRGRSLQVIGEPLAFGARGEVHHYEFDAREVVA